MKIKFVSEITLSPVANEIKRSHPEWIIEDFYIENLENYLLISDDQNNFDLIYFHIDNFFKRKRLDDLDQILLRIGQFSQKSNCQIIISNVLVGPFAEGGMKNNWGFIPESFRKISKRLNELKSSNSVYIFDLLSIITNVGIQNTYNFQLGHLYQMPYTKSVIKKIATSFSLFVQRLFEPDKKVIVLDCDNTLWGGIIGEDGPDGVKCDLNDDGILYYHFQQFLVQKKNEGFLLTLCSKNNESDVKDVFFKKKMPLKWDDFILTKVNWDNKVDNINSIAHELNIGVEALIFIDDSEFEINSVKQLLPQVTVVNFKDNYDNYLNIIEDYDFRKKNLTEEDFRKNEQYKDEINRRIVKDTVNSLEDYVKSLNITFEIKENSFSDIDRLSQLTEKTNQFNFNKKPYTAIDLHDAVSQNRFSLYSLKVQDRFGDYGIVGLIIISHGNNGPILENFIMSCRALGRGIEQNFFDEVNQRVKSTFGKVIESIKFVPTEKNMPASIFIKKNNLL